MRIRIPLYILNLDPAKLCGSATPLKTITSPMGDMILQWTYTNNNNKKCAVLQGMTQVAICLLIDETNLGPSLSGLERS